MSKKGCYKLILLDNFLKNLSHAYIKGIINWEEYKQKRKKEMKRLLK